MRILLFLMGFLGSISTIIAQDLNTAVVDPVLLDRLEAEPEAGHDVFFLLADRVDVTAMDREFYANQADQQERISKLIPALQQKAAETQGDLLRILEDSDEVEAGSVRSLWITNMVFARVKKSLLQKLSWDSSIEAIGWNAPLEPVGVEAESFASPMPPVPNGVEPGLNAIQAPFMWNMGYTGYGRKGFIVDTGVDPDHPALRRQYNGHYFPANESWYNPASNQGPYDCDDHGTHVAGTTVGLDRLTNDTIGVAYNSLWIASPAIGCSNTFGGFSALQWALNPDGNSGTVDDVPAVINNSWGNPGSSGCNDTQYKNLLQALEAAGIAVVFSAGNEGPGISTLRSPANINETLVNAFAVGSLNGNSSSLLIASTSSRGPSSCGGTGSLLIKPEVSAPGVNVRSAVPGGYYDQKSGTSMAAPHVSGALLLLKEAFPDVLGKELKESLYYTCSDLGEPGEDNDYGMGIINLEAAFNYLLDAGHTPVDPVKAHDVMLVDATVNPVNCNQSIKGTILVENSGTEILTSFTAYYGLKNLQPASYTWNGSLEPGERTTVNLPAAPAALLGNRFIQIDVDEPNGEADGRPLNNRIVLQTLITDLEIPEVSMAGNQTSVCAGSEVVLLSGINNDPDIQVNWYDDPFEGNLLGSGDSYPTAALSETTPFYAEYAYTEKVGPEDSGNGELFYGGAPGAANNGLFFDAYHPFTLKSVKVYSENSGWRFLKLRNGEGDLLIQKPILIEETGEVRVELDIDVPAGNNFRLELDLSAPLGYILGGTDYPYEIEDIVKIKKSTYPGGGGSTSYYHYFFDWEIEYKGLCGRSEFVVEVGDDGNLPVAAFSASADQLDLDSGNDTVTFTDDSDNATSWFWNFGDGSSSEEQSPEHTFTNPGIYLVTLTVEGPDGCTSVASQEITVEGALTDTQEAMASNPSILLFPNPAQDQVTVRHSFPAGAALQIRIVDALGRPIQYLSDQPSPGAEVTISLDRIPDGLYFVLFLYEGNQYARKLIVSRGR